MAKDREATGISISEIINRGIELYYQNERSPDLLKIRANALVDNAIELIIQAARLEYPDADKEDIAREMIVAYYAVRSKTCKWKRIHFIDVNFQKELDSFLIDKVVNADILFPRAKELAKDVWYSSWDGEILSPTPENEKNKLTNVNS